MYKSLTFFLAMLVFVGLLHATDEEAVLTTTKITALRTHVFNGHDVDVNGKHRDFFENVTGPLGSLSGPETEDILGRMGQVLLNHHGEEAHILKLCIAWYKAHPAIESGSEKDLLSYLDNCPELTGNFSTDLEQYLTPIDDLSA